MPKPLSIVIAQLNAEVGNISKNTDKALAAIQEAKQQQADLIIFPELFLCGYQAEDLFYRSEFHQAIAEALQLIQAASDTIHIIMPHPKKTAAGIFNSASVFYKQRSIAHYDKQKLPNEDIFDEKRYFIPGKEPCIFQINNISIGLLICEDIWHAEPVAQTTGAEILIVANASPFAMDQEEKRYHALAQHDLSIPILYVNLIGGQEDVVFDGGSFVMSHKKIVFQLPYFVEQIGKVFIDTDTLAISPAMKPAPLIAEEKMYRALVLGVRDYVKKNNFQSVLLGLSGGIDSALSLCIAVDAVGEDQVEAILMPSQYTSELSNREAIEQANTLGVAYRLFSIETVYESFLTLLQPLFHHDSPGLTEQNIQARCRGILLMALSNEFKKLVLTTGNRSELAMGYCTLYGDMAGAFCVLKDVPKTWVYKLAKYRNSLSPVIPTAVIERAPSAELAPNQVDQDQLPPYDILDAILELYINQQLDAKEIIQQGYDAELVNRIIRTVNLNEYKRKQSPPGTRLHTKAFGRDRRYPINFPDLQI